MAGATGGARRWGLLAVHCAALLSLRRFIAPFRCRVFNRASVASRIRCRRLRAAIGAQRKAHRAAHTELYWQTMQRRDALRWPAQTDRLSVTRHEVLALRRRDAELLDLRHGLQALMNLQPGGAGLAVDEDSGHGAIFL